MTTAPLFDMVQHSVTGTPGTGAITLGAAVSGYQTFASAGAADGDIVSYSIADASNAWEVGHATYNSAGPTLSSRVVTFSSNGNAALSLTSAAVVSNALLAADLLGQGQLSAAGITANAQLGSINLPANAVITQALIRETAGVTVNLAIGSTSGGVDVLSAVSVPASGMLLVPGGDFSTDWFSTSVSQAIYLSSTTPSGWSINIFLAFRIGP